MDLPAGTQNKEPQFTCKLRIVISDKDKVVRTNNEYNLRPDHWKNDIDSLTYLIPGLTNAMKIELKKEGYLSIEEEAGLTEFFIQVSESSTSSDSSPSEVSLSLT